MKRSSGLALAAIAAAASAGATARRVIDASGLVVAPGFIDMMGQSGFFLMA
jgi:N-acyl-D-aspartate/D-glutamate deacylase